MTGHMRALSRRTGALAAAGCIAIGLAACGSSSSSGSGSSGSSNASTGSSPPPNAATSTTVPTTKVKGNKKVILVTCEPNVFCHAYNINLTQKLKASGVKVTQLSDNFDPAVQNQHMNQAIAQKPDAIVLFASNADAIVPALRRAKAAGVPVVNVDARLKPNGDKLVTFNAVANNAALGRSAAQNLVEGMKKAGHTSGKIISITGTMGTLIVQDRLDAFQKYMKQYPQYKVVATQDGNWDQVKSSQIALQLLTKYRSQGGIQGAYGMADYQAAGIIQAAQQLGIPTGVNGAQSLVVTGSNCTPTGYPLLASGKLYGDATQSPIHESNTAYTHVAAFLNGQKQPHMVVDKEIRFTTANYKDFEQLCSQWPK
jgi:ABC-type sugar transport system substrate-binding protein